jgi:chitinase
MQVWSIHFIVIFMSVKLVYCLLLLLALAACDTVQDRDIRPIAKRKATVYRPIKFIYINRLTSWWGNLTLPAALAVPGFTATPLPYNYVAVTFWTYPGNAQDASGMWANIGANMGPNEYGTNNSAIQKTLKKNFTNNGVNLMVSAFGDSQKPTSAGYDPIDCANKLAQFVIDNNLDGVDIDWEDSPAFEKGDGSGEDWLITLTKRLRYLLPDSIITHAPQAPYFVGTKHYPKGGYIAVHEAVGDLIDFYNVQFYNQGVGVHDTAEQIFNTSGGVWPGCSINEIIAAGVPASKIVLGKPATPADGNNGWMSAAALNKAITDNYAYNGWKTGIMFWQFTSDINGTFCNDVGQGIITNVNEADEADEADEANEDIEYIQ